MDPAAWDERYAATDLVWSAGPNQFVEQELAGLAPGRALDLACGEGRNARWLAEQGWHVTAMDFSPVAIETGRRLTAELDGRIEWVVGDALTAPLPADLGLVVVRAERVARGPASDALVHVVGR
jgi:SAM-dependent methyltransferase